MNILSRNMRIVPVALVMGTIFFLSHQSGTELSLPPVPGLDKLAHAMIYAVLAAAALYSVPSEFLRIKPGTAGLLVVLFCILYGMTDEFHQSFISGRVASFGDLAADTVGAVIMVLLWLRYQRPVKPREG